ncbi:universal stress protein [Quadrisphaera setariae]|uniref:Universal stress protein n=1 Tax=Quadrisphaera setariae TaxID=2593304 RepID=A0A5C8Z5V0_9ACTN|nr:universal stress protein [Quadrisphaera setariae]TXR52511.1 universal stress protein [Quadrisphaera setariae]
MSSSPIQPPTRPSTDHRDHRDHRDSRPTVVVGVLPGQLARVLHEAAALARDLGGSLLAVHVDTTHYRRSGPDGQEHWFPIDPDSGGDAAASEDGSEDGGEGEDGSRECADLDDLVQAAAGGVPVTTVHVTGDPVRELAAAAERVDARVIVVGAGAGGWRGSVGEVFSGSVAVHLAHRQHRPVLVVPHGDGLAHERAVRR